MKAIQIGTVLFTDDMIFYVENPKKKSTGKLELISHYRKVVRYKINIIKPVAFLYNNNEQMEFETENAIAFTLAPSKMKAQV